MTHPYPSRPIRVIHVRGNPFQVGAQHAQLVGGEMDQGMTAFYSGFWRRMLAFKGGSVFDRAALKVAAQVIDRGLAGVLRRNLPLSVMQLLRGVSQGDSARLNTLMTSTVLPDLMPILLSLSVQLRPHSVIPAAVSPFVPAAPIRFGCSSFFSNEGPLIHGRNLDFPGVGYWDRFPLIQMTDTRKGMRYIGFTTSGVPLCGITGVNEEQVSVSLHQHYCREYSFGGVPPFVIAEQILAQARNLDDALNILRGSRVSAAWAFLVGDGKARDAFLFECHPRKSGIIRLKDRGGVLAHTNFFQTAECSPSGYAASARMNWDNSVRKQRLEENVRKGGLTPASACQFLSEHVDGVFGHEKMINRTVSQVYNVCSVVLDLTSMQAWIAEGDCPIHLRHYAHFDLGEIFSGRQGRTGAAFPGYRFRDESLRLAKQAYILSFVAAFDGDEAGAAAEIERALCHSFSTEAALVAGVLCLKAMELERARSFFERAVAFSENLNPRPPEYYESILFLGRALDLLGKRTSALAAYQMVWDRSGCEDAHLMRLAECRIPYRLKDLRRILTPYSSYVPFE